MIIKRHHIRFLKTFYMYIRNYMFSSNKIVSIIRYYLQYRENVGELFQYKNYSLDEEYLSSSLLSTPYIILPSLQ